MVFTVTISDGVDTVTLTPGHNVGRVIDSSPGLVFMDRPNQANPKAKDRKMMADTFTVQTDFNSRPNDFDTLVNMIKDRTPGQEYTLTIQRKTASTQTGHSTNEVYTVAFPTLRKEYGGGEGEMRNVTLSFRVVAAIS